MRDIVPHWLRPGGRKGISPVNAHACLAGLALSLLPALALAEVDRLDAPNVVEISPRLVTSGQPTAAALGRLKSQGFGAVIYLAPPSVPDAVRDERDIVERQGLAYVNIPIRFDRPTEGDFKAFSAALAKVADRKVLVHCQVNLRASSMVFLQRVAIGGEAPQEAYEAVAKVWSPNGPWKALLEKVLRNHGVNFQPY